MGIKIEEFTIAKTIEELREGTWQVPKFQREFVWDTSAIAGLATSIIDAYPIGMVTLWHQSESDPLSLENLSIQDYDSIAKKRVTKTFGKPSTNNLMAILDGRQRCTAIAMAFAGFMPTFGGNKYCGRYFLNAAQVDPLERVVFIKRSDLEKKGLTTLSGCIGQGYFPLASDDPDEGVLRQWYRYAQEIKNPDNYPNGKLPGDEEISRRNKIVESAFDGINDTRLAACVVPSKYDLGQICEIFETLNLTGMKVSTVDLINSWIYKETTNTEAEDENSDSIEIREWMRDLGQLDGAVGWSVPEKRPELIAQIVTAAFVALDDLPDKPKPRQVSGNKKVTKILSVKSPDLLATPTKHWMNVVNNGSKLAGFIGDFQRCVAGGLFGYDKAPYPISSAIYVGLRWHKHFDPDSSHNAWTIEDLNSLYKAFFWRNSLSRRYDQGFLTTIGSDIRLLKTMLSRRKQFSSKAAWFTYCKDMFESDDLIPTSKLPTEAELFEILTNGRPGGALQSAIQLPIIAGVDKDINGIGISYPSDHSLELHHIYPTKWCKKNASGELRDILDRDKAGKDWVNSVANLMPLSRITNNAWKELYPRNFIEEHDVTYKTAKGFFESVYIGKNEFELLSGGPEQIEQFWTARAKLMAKDLISRTELES